MTPLAVDVIDFMASFGDLPPEDTADLRALAEASTSLEDLVASVRNDRRFAWAVSQDFHLPAGLGLNDHLFCTDHIDPNATAADGYVTDCFGIRTQTDTATKWAPLDGTVQPWTFRGCFEHDAMEWFALLDSIRVSKPNDTFHIMELGAGWGPWITAGAVFAKRQGLSNIHVTAVEGDRQRFEFITRHRKDNGVDDVPLTAHHAVVGPFDGTALFPVLPDSTHDMGFAAIFDRDDPATIGKDYRGAHREHIKVASKGLPGLLKDGPIVDFLHVDIQNSEAMVIAAALDELDQFCRRMYVATHSRSVEWEVAQSLMGRGWVLMKEKACEMHFGDAYTQTGRTWPLVLKDGAQYWRNPAFD
ncbi:class I SAM-dependent methyltransferase [Pseudooctadecabacter jejudonensis]|uniref:Methyltransferase FkbM domain-containing protein n=1 Tax=Pseudooctadecabacter jejudonensis TaxID=1391910 RepID=A0A1Y5T489_9RHOB|nr:hypothetical protein [Pseudooctadecabacter jejudonensis]SLN55411.1 hypothetical protein PSJ8397_02913 [Pseudooctadecabacter jejudonensis]